MRKFRLITAAALMSVLSGCGEGADTATPAVTVTTTRTAPAPAEDDGPTAGDGTPEAEGERPPDTEEAEAKALPNVVGMNLQEGQDTMQAAGFPLLNDKDATGRNRLQVFDRNWVITRQDPGAGEKVSVDTLVTLYAKKIGE